MGTTYEFGKIINRFGTDCLKYDFLEKMYGSKEMISMWVADMDFPVANEIVEELQKTVAHGIFGYAVKTESYYDSIINWYQKRHNLFIDRKSMIYTPGIVPALSWCVLTYSQKGDKVVIQTPVYGPFLRSVKNNHRQLVENPLHYENGQYTIDFKRLDRDLCGAKIFLFCSPHNPVGRVWTQEELEQVCELCIKHNVLLVSDEIHCDLIHKPNKHIPIHNVCEAIKAHSIAMIAPSKTFNLAGLSASTMLVPNPDLFNQFATFLTSISMGMTNLFAIEGTKAAYNHGEEWLNQVLDYIKGNYLYIKQFMQEHLKDLVPMDLQATYLMWIDCSALKEKGVDIKSLFEQEAKIAGEIGTEFGSEYSSFYRLNIAMPRSQIEIAMKQLYKAYSNLCL